MRWPDRGGNVFISATEWMLNSLAKTISGGYHSSVSKLFISPIR